MADHVRGREVVGIFGGKAIDPSARGWCRDKAAMDVNGTEVHPTSERAIAWCALGALDAAGIPYLYHQHGPHPAYRRLQDQIGPERLMDFNARQESVGPVLTLFDRAIADRPSQL